MIPAVLDLFHHIHHEAEGHCVYHCGGAHREIDPTVDYTIVHCACGKHRIDKESATGHATGIWLECVAVQIRFVEICPEGGWHVESGTVA